MEKIDPRDIIEFWFADSLDRAESAVARSKFWYQANPHTDAEIKQRFGPVLESLLHGVSRDYFDWETSPQGALALVILLDQFTRNIYRGDARAFSGDQLALQIARRAIQSGLDQKLPGLYRVFLYHPFHHSEHLEDQEDAVAFMQGVEDQLTGDWRAFVNGFTKYSIKHMEIVKRFGRFPHRNRILNRNNTQEEQSYLDDGASRYGQ